MDAETVVILNKHADDIAANKREIADLQEKFAKLPAADNSLAGKAYGFLTKWQKDWPWTSTLGTAIIVVAGMWKAADNGTIGPPPKTVDVPVIKEVDHDKVATQVADQVSARVEQTLSPAKVETVLPPDGGAKSKGK